MVWFARFFCRFSRLPLCDLARILLLFVPTSSCTWSCRFQSAMMKHTLPMMSSPLICPAKGGRRVRLQCLELQPVLDFVLSH
jgi:hypothetical protein